MTRGVPISNDLRKAVLHMAKDHSKKEIWESTGVKLRSVERIVSEVERGALRVPKERAPAPPRVLSDECVQFLIACIQRKPDLYLDELRDKLVTGMNTLVHPSTISRALRKAGLSMKTITKAAREQDPIKRAEYIRRISKYEPHERVYVDESRFDRRNAIRNRAWAFHGERALRRVFFLRGKSYSVLPALSLDGVIHVKIVENAFNTETFNDFICGLLLKMNPYDPVNHNPNSVIILDNCRIHKSPEMIQMVLDHGARIEFLPPYSPDFNPIELCFSGMKAWMKRYNEAAQVAWDDRHNEEHARWLLYDMAYSPTQEMALGWFMKAGVL